jgi:hypothetical protein
MKTIATLWKVEEAHLLRLQLEESGIEAFLQNEHTTQLYPWLAAANGGVQLQVADSDFERALKILRKSVLQSEVNISAEADEFACCGCQAPMAPTQKRCPKCGWSDEDSSVGGFSEGPWKE